MGKSVCIWFCWFCFLLLLEITCKPSTQLNSCFLQFGFINKLQLSESCVVDCPVSCILSDWSPWADCSHTCGTRGKHEKITFNLVKKQNNNNEYNLWSKPTVDHVFSTSLFHLLRDSTRCRICTNTLKCFKICTRLCNPQPYYTVKLSTVNMNHNSLINIGTSEFCLFLLREVNYA